MKAGELYRYPEGLGWCRHGILKVEESRGGLVLRDTYWSGHGQDDRLWSESELAGKIEFVLDLSVSRKVHREEYGRYRDEDRAYIPVGGHREEYWVRADATPDKERILAQLRGNVESAESALRRATYRLDRAHAELTAYLSEHGEECSR